MADRTVSVGLQANVRGFVSGVQRARAESDRMSRDLARHAATNEEAWTRTGQALLGIGVAAGAGVAAAVAKFALFDREMSQVAAATGETGESLDRLRDAAVRAGADTAFSATEAAQGITELSKAGVSAEDILAGGLDGALSLAAAGGLDVADAASIAATALTQFKLEGRDVTHVADLLAAGAGKAQGDVSDLGAALNQSGQVAQQTGLSIEETTGALTAFASAGLLGSDAGTSFKSMLQRLTPQSAEAERLMDELGISAYDAGGQFVGLEAFAGNLQTALRDLTPEQRNSAMATIFGSDAVRAASVIYEQGATGIAKWTAAVDDQGYASDQAAAKLDNLLGDWEAFTGSTETGLIRLGESGNGPLRELTQDATTLVNVFADMPAGVQQGVVAVGAVTTAVGLTSGALFLLTPRAVAANAALASMGPAGAKAAAGLGAAARGVVALSPVLAALGIAAGIGIDAWIDQRQAIDAYTDSLDEATGAITDATRALAIKALQDTDAYDAARALGLAEDVVTDAALGNAEAMAKVAEVTARASAEQETGTAKSGDLMRAIMGTAVEGDNLALSASYLTETLGEQNGRLVEARARHAEYMRAMDGTSASTHDLFREVTQLGTGIETTGILSREATAPTDDLAASVEGVAEEALTAEEQLDALSSALDDLLGAELGVQEATDATEQAIADLAERVVDADGKVESLSGGLSDNSQAARDNRAAINDAMEAVAAEAEARVRAGEDIATVTGRIYASRDALVEEAIKRGASREEAEAYTDALLDIPSRVTSLIETPGMATAKRDAEELKKILDNMPKNLKISTEVYTSEAKRDLATARRGAQGDAPGSFSGTLIGGKALARVQSSLPGGLRITSTYRSPAHNARVGGSPTSKHMDRNNPAVDIGGPTALLDIYAARLAAMGGWRQLLWRVPGHYDHIHVAHSGGAVESSWRRQPGDGPDERTARLQVGERVLSKAEVGAAKYGRPAAYAASAAGPAGRRTEVSIQQTVNADGLVAGQMAQSIARAARTQMQDAIAANGLAGIAAGA